jgi:phosphonate transport system substrate-binding protein
VSGTRPLRFALPSSAGADAEGRTAQLRAFLGKALSREVEVLAPASSGQLARELLAGTVDAAWAPPLVCARIEAMGVRVLVRSQRRGASTIRAALVCRRDSAVTLDTLTGSSAAWADRDSVGGYLLAMAFLHERGQDPGKTFSTQAFLGSDRASLQAVLEGRADVASVAASHGATGLEDAWPEQAQAFRVLGYTADAPHDGVAVSMSASPALVTELEKAFLGMHHGPAGAQLLADCFHAERFEAAPRMGYRALYRVALASL